MRDASGPCRRDLFEGVLHGHSSVAPAQVSLRPGPPVEDGAQACADPPQTLEEYDDYIRNADRLHERVNLDKRLIEQYFYIRQLSLFLLGTIHQAFVRSE
jgi:hypothetical protein